MPQYIPFPAYADDAPIDLRFVYEGERPAGKHGFLQVQGDDFVFEDGTPGRFWGTNFNGGANFPEFDYAQKVSRRLAKIGVNIVRFHQLDSEWNTPNIFQFTKGKRLGNTQHLDPESMKRLDYLIFCLKNEGIYVYLDIFTYRKFKSGDGVENAYGLDDAAKPYSGYNRRLIELQKKLALDIWTHENPYTGLKYKDDPVFVMGEVVNESDLFSRAYLVEPYISEFRELFGRWLKQKGIAYDALGCDLQCGDEPLLRFKIELQEQYYREMIGYMRGIGVKIPLCGTNWSVGAANTKTQLIGDFLDGHVYFYDWKWGEKEKHCMNRRITGVFDQGFDALSMARVFGKPYFVSEWDVPWPNEYRAEGPILYAAVGALQHWAGFAIHTYAYSNRLDRMEVLGKEVSSASIGGVPYREGIFSTWNDPAKFGLFYHSALITRRGDVSPAEKKVEIPAGELKPLPREKFRAMSEKCQIAIGLDGKTAASGDYVEEKSGEVRSVNNELYRSWEKGFGTVDTPRTKCVYGLLAKNAPVTVRGLSVSSDTDFAVVALSSLTDAPIVKSDNMLLTAVGRAMNTGAKFDGEQMIDCGRPPILIEVIEARIAISTPRRDLKVWAVNAEGFFVGALPTEYRDGCLRFQLGDIYPSMYYLIQAE